MTLTILNNSTMQLAQTLSELLKRDKKLTPTALARILGIPANKITRILNGDVIDPKASTLVQIANHFDISIEQLLGFEPLRKQGEKVLLSNSVLPVFRFKQNKLSKVPHEWYRWAENEVEGDYYALILDSDLYEPTFQSGAVLIINPDIGPEDRSYIIVTCKTSLCCSIKKYVLEGSQIFLYPIHPRLPVDSFDKNLHSISGVILEVHQKLHSKK